MREAEGIKDGAGKRGFSGVWIMICNDFKKRAGGGQRALLL